MVQVNHVGENIKKLATKPSLKFCSCYQLSVWRLGELLCSHDMAEKGESSDEEPTIAEDVVVTKYKMAGDMANSELEYFLPWK